MGDYNACPPSTLQLQKVGQFQTFQAWPPSSATAEGRQRNGSALGPSGWSGDLLSLLGHDESCTQALAILVQDIMNGLVPTSVRDHLLCCKLIGIPKDDGGVRTIAMAEPIVKLALHYASSRTNDAIVDVPNHMQLGVGVPGGSERALHRVQCLLEAGSPNTVAVLVDFENAFRALLA
jgi:hypothetical protein